jgi:small-conductance mechanosensitive channel
MLFAILIALTVFSLLVRLARRIFAARNPDVFSFIRRSKGLLRYALILLALSIAARNMPYDPQLAASLGRLFQVGFIVMLGWLALIAINMAADVYLMRFRVDVEDNLLARKHVTQVRVLRRSIQTVVVLIVTASAMMTFETVRQFGVSLFASAGIAGIVVGFAARPLLTSLLAGIQIAMTQPIRIDDAVVVENE